MAPIATNPVANNPPILATKIPSRLYRLDSPASLVDFQKLCAQTCSPSDYPLTSAVKSNIPIYDLSLHQSTDAELVNSLQDEWNHILLSGPGVLVLQNFLPNASLIDHINSIFASIITSEASTSKGDHFAPAGTNFRVWNSFQKHALRDPASFLAYYANPWLRHISTAWLGPSYQLTAQLNIVRPGGKPQVAHRDYHLGFQSAESCAAYPKAMQTASQFLTLQGGIAHSDVPLESGPTRFLPFSQRFDAGYMAYRLSEFRDYFDRNWVSLPLWMGDAVFFNPALVHAAGENRTSDVQRSVNLLQVSSPFGRAMESVDTIAIVEKCFDGLKEMFEKEEGVSERVQAAIEAIAEGYPFPTNLDCRPPGKGMAPESQVDVLARALRESWGKNDLMARLMAMRKEDLP